MDEKVKQSLSDFGELKLERRLFFDMREGANFTFDSAKLSSEAKQCTGVFIDDVQNEIAAGANPPFLIAGHTDNTGSGKLAATMKGGDAKGRGNWER